MTYAAKFWGGPEDGRVMVIEGEGPPLPHIHFPVLADPIYVQSFTEEEARQVAEVDYQVADYQLWGIIWGGAYLYRYNGIT